MNRRQRKKQVELALCIGLDVPMMLHHAKASYWKQDEGARRHSLARQIVRTFRLPSSVAHRAVNLTMR